MAFTFRSPANKANRFQDQLKSGKVKETGQQLSESDRRYRYGYVDAVRESQSIYAYNNASIKEREQYKAGRKQALKELREKRKGKK